MTTSLKHLCQFDHKDPHLGRHPYFDVETLGAYAKADIKLLERVYGSDILKPKKVKPPKTWARSRTISDRKYEGFKDNKPKHNWGKKRRARMGWAV